MPVRPPAFIDSPLFALSPFALFCCTREGMIVAANGPALSLSGHGMADLTGRHFASLLPDESAQGFTQQCAGAGCTTLETGFQPRTGAATQVEIAISRIQEPADTLWLLLTVRDISLQHEAQQRLLEQEQLFARIIDGSDQGFWDWDLQAQKFSVSPRFLSMLGYAVGEIDLSVEEWSKHVHPEDFPRAMVSIERHLRGETPTHDVELRCRTKDGEWKWIRTCGRVVVRDAAGQPLIMSGIHTDISSRKMTEQSLLESELILREAQDIARIGNWRWDVVHDQHFWSPEIYRIYGRDPALPPAVYPEVRDYFTEASWALLAAKVEAALSGQIDTYECDAELRSDGNPRWIMARGRVIRDRQGKIVTLAGTVQDISDRKAIEEELRSHRDHLEELVRQRAQELDALYNKAPCGYHSLDPSGLIVSINDTELRMLGYRREEIQGVMNIRDLLAPGDLPCFEATFPVFLQTGQVRDLAFHVRHKDGSLLPVLISGDAVRDADGTYLYSSSTMTDNAERSARDEQIATLSVQLAQRAAEAESATQAKSQFLANMSHEIRTPLNAILGMAHLLHQSPLSPQQSQQLGKIDASARLLLNIISDILDLSKIEAGKMALEEVPLDPAAIAGDVMAMLGEQIRSKGLNAHLDHDRLPAGLVGDPTRITQALLNYASNAVKFTARGSVGIYTRLAGETDESALIRFEVSDTGVGLSEEEIAHLFRDFEQADKSTTRKFGGTGLGLAITRRLAHLMGGETGVTSIPGQGSTFWISMRLKKTALSTPSAVEALPPAEVERQLRECFGHCRLLLAEDDEINQEVAISLLEDVGLHVDIADNGAMAVRYASERTYALVLMDMQMPVMDGIEATRQIRRKIPANELPIIAMTANAFSEDRDHCLEAGMNDFVSKPIYPDLLYSKLLEWLRQSAAGNSCTPT